MVLNHELDCEELTAQSFQAISDLLQITGLYIANISHEVGNLNDVSTLLKEVGKRRFAYISLIISDLLVNVVVSKDFINLSQNTWNVVMDVDHLDQSVKLL